MSELSVGTLVKDVFSTVILAYHIADVTEREQAGEHPLDGGFDTDDVLAALASAACAELATPATREFAGFLPQRLRVGAATTAEGRTHAR